MRLLAIDIETTDVPPQDVHILQIGTVSPCAQWVPNQGLRLPLGVEISEGAAAVHGWTTEAWRKNHADQKHPERALHDVLDSVTRTDWIVTHNGVRFDVPLLRLACIRYGLNPAPLDFARVIDTKLWHVATVLDRPYLPGVTESVDTLADLRRTVPSDLDTLARVYHVEPRPAGTHDACADAALTLRVCEAMLAHPVCQRVISL